MYNFNEKLKISCKMKSVRSMPHQWMLSAFGEGSGSTQMDWTCASWLDSFSVRRQPFWRPNYHRWQRSGKGL